MDEKDPSFLATGAPFIVFDPQKLGDAFDVLVARRPDVAEMFIRGAHQEAFRRLASQVAAERLKQSKVDLAHIEAMTRIKARFRTAVAICITILILAVTKAPLLSDIGLNKESIGIVGAAIAAVAGFVASLDKFFDFKTKQAERTTVVPLSAADSD